MTLEILVGSVHITFHENLNYQRFALVGTKLTNSETETRVNFCRENGDKYVFSHLVTAHEFWVHCYDPESKEESKQGKHGDSPSLTKFRVINLI